MKKLVLAIVFMLLVCHASQLNTTKAAMASEMYVHAKNELFVRTKPAANAEKLGTLKNHSKVTVFSSSNGWSFIQAGKTKGYVSTTALSKKKPKTVPAVVTGGLTPVDGLILTYAPSFTDSKKEAFTAKKEYGDTYIFTKNSPGYADRSAFTYIEDKERLLMGVSDSDFIFVDVPYPLKQGTYVKDWSYGYEKNVLVESTTKTITVKGGTFRNTVILRYPDGSREYLAKGIGIIKSTASNGKIITELVSYKARK